MTLDPELPTDPPRAQPQALPGRQLVRVAVFFYAALLGVAVLWTSLAGRSLFYASAEAQRRGVDPVGDAALGLLAGVAVVAVTREFTWRTSAGQRLARELAALTGRLSPGQCLALAALSGVGEEALFRGALQPQVGLVIASIVFGLVHFVPRREFLPWTGFCLVAGFLLGGLFALTGNLLAPVLAHAFVNGVNLHMLSSRFAPD